MSLHKCKAIWQIFSSLHFVSLNHLLSAWLHLLPLIEGKWWSTYINVTQSILYSVLMSYWLLLTFISGLNIQLFFRLVSNFFSGKLRRFGNYTIWTILNYPTTVQKVDSLWIKSNYPNIKYLHVHVHVKLQPQVHGHQTGEGWRELSLGWCPGSVETGQLVGHGVRVRSDSKY